VDGGTGAGMEEIAGGVLGKRWQGAGYGGRRGF